MEASSPTSTLPIRWAPGWTYAEAWTLGTHCSNGSMGKRHHEVGYAASYEEEPMRVLVADEFPRPQLEALRGLGLSVDFRPELKPDELPEAAKETSILVVRGKEVGSKVFEQAHALSLV